MRAYDQISRGNDPKRTEFRALHPIRHVNQLLALNDVVLVETLFVGLLNRPATPQELDFYSGQLRAGLGKAEIIVDIAALPEVTAEGLAIPGLQQHIARQKRLRRSIWRFLGRGRQHERRLNSLENSLGQVSQDLEILQREMRQRLEALESRLNSVPADGPTQNTGALTGQRDDLDLTGVSVAVRRIFREVAREVESANNQKQM
jgi:hypothetical protein